MALRCLDTGACDFALLKTLTSTRNVVTNNATRPGTISGLMMNDNHDTITNMAEVR